MKGLVIGPGGAGKTTLCNALAGIRQKTFPTQMFKMIGMLMDTPGVYLENPGLYHTLIVSEQLVDVMLLVISADQQGDPIPPGFAQIFSRQMYGVISKIDLEHKDEARARKILVEAGAIEPFWRISAKTGAGLYDLNQWLLQKK